MTEHTEITFKQDERADFGELWTGLERDTESGGRLNMDESNTVGIDPEEIPKDATAEDLKQMVEERLSSDE